MSRARPLPLPPSGISVWRPLDSSEDGLVAILGTGPSGRDHVSDEDVQCVWCGLRSSPAPACDICGSPLYESIAIWQPTPNAGLEPPAQPVSPTAPVRARPAPPPATDTTMRTPPRTVSFWPAAPATLPSEAPDGPPPPEPAPPVPPPPKESPFKAFRRFAGLEIHWVRRADQ